MTAQAANEGAGRWGWLPAAAIAVVFLAFGLLLWRGWQQYGGGVDEAVPIARAEGAYKRPPTEAERAANQPLNADSPFVQDLSGEPVAYERILPGQDEPPRSLDDLLAERPDFARPAEAPPAQAPPAQAPPTETPPTVEPAAPPVAARPAPEPAVVAAAPVVPPPPAVTPGAGWRLQLVALRDRASTEAAWVTFKDRHAAVLGSLEPEIDAGDDGGAPIYRLRAGPFAGRAEAIKACERLQEDGGECFVVGPSS